MDIGQNQTVQYEMDTSRNIEVRHNTVYDEPIEPTQEIEEQKEVISLLQQ